MSTARLNDPVLIQRVLMADGTAAEIAERFGITERTVRRYKQRETYAAMAAEAALRQQGMEPPVWNPTNQGMRRFSDHDVVAIRASHAPAGKLAKAFGVSRVMIWNIRAGRTYKGVK